MAKRYVIVVLIGVTACLAVAALLYLRHVEKRDERLVADVFRELVESNQQGSLTSSKLVTYLYSIENLFRNGKRLPEADRKEHLAFFCSLTDELSDPGKIGKVVRIIGHLGDQSALWPVYHVLERNQTVLRDSYVAGPDPLKDGEAVLEKFSGSQFRMKDGSPDFARWKTFLESEVGTQE